MKIFRLIGLFGWLSFLSQSCQSPASMGISERLETLPGAHVFVLNNDTSGIKTFKILIEQPLDHGNPEGARFVQRLFLTHVDSSLPMVVITEGYDADYNYSSELAQILGCNQLIVEHRFFGNSIPDSMDWALLNIMQSAADHHRIIELFKETYTGPWITTGVSKGGQTALYHRYFYPEDVDITVPYVAPLNFSSRDHRINEFLGSVGDSICRVHIGEFQERLLTDREIYFPWFLNFVLEKGLTFQRLGPEAAYEMAVLEYDFAFWQYAVYDCNQIPTPEVQDMDAFNHFVNVSNPRFFSDQGILNNEPFFYQALTEIGFYEYETTAFEDLLEWIEDPGFQFALPNNEEVQFNPEPMKLIDDFVKNEAERILFIYGETDAWSATAVETGDNDQIVKVVKPGGSHGTRIMNLPDDQKEEVLGTLEKWLDIPINR